MAKFKAFIATDNKPAQRINSMIEHEEAENIRRNHNILKSIISAIVFCGRHGLALRDHRDDKLAESLKQKGIFAGICH